VASDDNQRKSNAGTLATGEVPFKPADPARFRMGLTPEQHERRRQAEQMLPYDEDLQQAWLLAETMAREGASIGNIREALAREGFDYEPSFSIVEGGRR
jgi:hypothetical protein